VDSDNAIRIDTQRRKGELIGPMGMENINGMSPHHADQRIPFALKKVADPEPFTVRCVANCDPIPCELDFFFGGGIQGVNDDFVTSMPKSIHQIGNVRTLQARRHAMNGQLHFFCKK
jgi:hypothetical protein